MKTEIWAMPPEHIEELFGRIESFRAMFSSGVDMLATQKAAIEQERSSHAVEDGVAHVVIAGPIMKSVPWFVRAMGIEATGSLETAETIRELAAADDVKEIVLDVDSPGGQVSGLHHLVDAVREATESKTVKAYASDMAASAAYWVGAQASEFTASRGASIGSIGVYAAVPDMSEAFANAGVKIHVFSSGKYKGAGVEGSPVDDDAKAAFQERVDEAAAAFVAEVAEGRKMGIAAVEKLATGKTWAGPTAAKHGLIDRVESRKSFAARLMQPASVEGAQTEVITMSVTKESFDALEARTAALADRFDGVAKENEELRAEVSQLREAQVKEEALRKAAEASLKATEDAQKADLLKAAIADGRVLPPAAEAWKTVADVCGVEEFKAKLEAQPRGVGVRPGVVGSMDSGNGLSAGQSRIANFLGLDEETMARAIEEQNAQDEASRLEGVE